MAVMGVEEANIYCCHAGCFSSDNILAVTLNELHGSERQDREGGCNAPPGLATCRNAETLFPKSTGIICSC